MSRKRQSGIEYEIIKIDTFYSILQRNLEKALEGKVSMPNTKLIYKTVMNTIFDVLKSLKIFQKINLTSWLTAERRVYAGKKCTPFERTNYATGEKFFIDYQPPYSKVLLKLKGNGKTETKHRMSDEEAAPFLEEKRRMMEAGEK